MTSTFSITFTDWNGFSSTSILLTKQSFHTAHSLKYFTFYLNSSTPFFNSNFIFLLLRPLFVFWKSFHNSSSLPALRPAGLIYLIVFLLHLLRFKHSSHYHCTLVKQTAYYCYAVNGCLLFIKNRAQDLVCFQALYDTIFIFFHLQFPFSINYYFEVSCWVFNWTFIIYNHGFKCLWAVTGQQIQLLQLFGFMTNIRTYH